MTCFLPRGSDTQAIFVANQQCKDLSPEASSESSSGFITYHNKTHFSPSHELFVLQLKALQADLAVAMTCFRAYTDMRNMQVLGWSLKFS